MEDTPLETVLPAGTIIECPDCGEGIYKVTVRVMIVEAVVNDDLFLAPLKHAMPPRDPQNPLVCPFCGGFLYLGDRIHTLQQGWV